MVDFAWCQFATDTDFACVDVVLTGIVKAVGGAITI